MAQPPQSDPDEYMRQYLARTDLGGLDLDDIDLQDDADAERRWLWGRLILALGCVAGLLWAMNSDLYLFHGHGTPWVPLLWACLAAAIATAGATTWLLQRGRSGPNMANLPHLAGALRHIPRPGPWRLVIPPTLQRYLLLTTGLTLGGVVLFYLPRDPQWEGSGYSSTWFWGVGAALVAGIALGRWLIAQAEAARARSSDGPPSPPIQWPPWTKWATLSLLICGALVATFGHLLSNGSDSPAAGFGLSGLGLCVGIFAAIWIGHRFDEWEVDLRAGRNHDKPRQ